MQFLTTTTLLAAATASLASTSTDSLTRRDNLCSLHNYPRLTEARVADVVNTLTSNGGTIHVRQGVCTQIGCAGGTKAGICVDSNGPTSYSRRDLGNKIQSAYAQCYGHNPDSNSGDSGFQAAYQVFESGYNILLEGSAPC